MIATLSAGFTHIDNFAKSIRKSSLQTKIHPRKHVNHGVVTAGELHTNMSRSPLLTCNTTVAPSCVPHDGVHTPGRGV